MSHQGIGSSSLHSGLSGINSQSIMFSTLGGGKLDDSISFETGGVVTTKVFSHSVSALSKEIIPG